MTEIVRMRERGERGRRTMWNRRDLLKGLTLGTVAGSVVTNVAAEGGALVVERNFLDDDTIDPMSTVAPDQRLVEMRDSAIAAARDIYAETGGLTPDWWEKARKAGVLEYATRIRKRDDGKQVIVSHGGGLQLWDRDAPEAMVGVPLDEQPDKKFGRFVDRCIFETMHRRTPALEARRAETILKGEDGPKLVEFYAWTASDGNEAVSVAMTMDQLARARSPLSRRPDTLRGDRHLLSRDATRRDRQADDRA